MEKENKKNKPKTTRKSWRNLRTIHMVIRIFLTFIFSLVLCSHWFIASNQQKEILVDKVIPKKKKKKNFRRLHLFQWNGIIRVRFHWNSTRFRCSNIDWNCRASNVSCRFTWCSHFNISFRFLCGKALMVTSNKSKLAHCAGIIFVSFSLTEQMRFFFCLCE